MKSTTEQVWQFEWMEAWDAIWDDGFVTEWLSWLESDLHAHVFFHPVLVRAWVESYDNLTTLQPRFLLARRGSETVFWPLVLIKQGWKGCWQRLLTPVGANEFDYHDPLVVSPGRAATETAFFQAFQGWLAGGKAKGFDRLYLPHLRILSPLAASSSVVNVAPYLDLEGLDNLEGLLSTLGKRQRGEIRRNLRRLDEAEKSCLQVYEADEVDEVLDFLPELLARHAQKWPNSYKAPDFHANLIRHGLPAGVVHVSVLRVGHIPVGWHIGFIFKQRFYWYLPVYDFNFAKLSPGRVHLVKVMEAFMANGGKIFDFLVGDEPYKKGWTSTQTLLRSQMLVMPGVGSRVRVQGAQRVRRVAGVIARYR
ncbi:MAG: GNAT family N-acetyltransferase [Magnetococcales bacterium]|nr:GNAT family N-acetyltransferase [Magnetococcales bacterium]